MKYLYLETIKNNVDSSSDWNLVCRVLLKNYTITFPLDSEILRKELFNYCLSYLIKGSVSIPYITSPINEFNDFQTLINKFFYISIRNYCLATSPEYFIYNSKKWKRIFRVVLRAELRVMISNTIRQENAANHRDVTREKYEKLKKSRFYK